LGIDRGSHALFDFTDDIRRHRITGNPAVFRFNADRTQHGLRLGLVLSLANLQRLGQLNRKNTLRHQWRGHWGRSS
jgi:hypothetical protein